MKIHHSRCIRFDGIELPYWQKMAENEWGLSVIEPLWDRMIAFDSATAGAAQLIYKAHLRVLKLPRFRELIAMGQGPAFQGVMNMITAIRSMQTNEGLTIIDGDDEFQANTYSFGGLSDMMIQFAQQVSGAADVPMTRMFGQSPAGMNSTGDSDLRNYYDGVKSGVQEGRLRRPVKILYDVTHRSLFGQALPKGFNFSFKPLWQLTEVEKAGIAVQHAQATASYVQDGVFTVPIAMKEARESSRVTGFGGNITDEDIDAAEAAPPPPDENDLEGAGPPDVGTPVPPPQAGQEASGGGLPPGDTPIQSTRPLRLVPSGREAEEGDAGDPPETTAHVHLAHGVRARANLPGGVRVNFDRQSIVDVGGLQCVVETAKGETRKARRNRWTVTSATIWSQIRSG